MFPTRMAVHAAAWTAVLLGCTAAAADAAPPSTPVQAVKPPEVSTVGTSPQFLTVAELRKRDQPHYVVSSKPTGLRAFEFLSPIPAFETRIPATGPRNRTKPIEIAGPKTGGAR